MTCSTDSIIPTDYRELRHQVGFWRAFHALAVEREKALKIRLKDLEERDKQFQSIIADNEKQIEALKSKIALLCKQVFGSRTEQTKETPLDIIDLDPVDSPSGDSSEQARKRGQQPGAKGHGRKRRVNLPFEEAIHELDEGQSACPVCGKAGKPFPGTEDSEEIEYQVVVRRVIHKRKRYSPGCDCGALPGIMTAPCPPKLIPKGMFDISFWVWLILEKFLFQRPLHRVRKVLELEGLSVSQGTLTGGLKRIGELIQPLYALILERSRSAKRWKMDETRRLVFVELEGKKGYRWWLWAVITEDAVVFLLEPSRSSQVPRDHLGEDAEGIINADRYSAYKALGLLIQIAFCWSHVRRDFVRIRDGYHKLRGWADSWVKRINELFHLNKKRLAAQSNPEQFQLEDKILRDAVDNMAEVRENELSDSGLHKASRKALESLGRHWEGLTIFVDHPEVPMDNNESERELRNPAVGRKNYYGSGSIWSGTLTAMIFTIFQTLLKNNIDPKMWLSAYFEACALNGGKPPEDAASFLPWNLSDEQKELWKYPKHPP